MQLTDEQSQQVSQWIAGGAKLSEIQSRLESDLGLRLTYMDVRLLVDDLHLTPQDPTPEPAPAPAPVAPASPGADAPGGAGDPFAEADEVLPPEGTPGSGKVALSVDQLARPGAMVSGRVTFSDGQTAEWYLDQMGRLGMVPPSPGYRPPQADVAEFQVALDRELVKLGF